MRKAVSFITAVLITASAAGGTWPVYAEDVPSEPAVNTENQESSVPGAENNSGNEQSSPGGDAEQDADSPEQIPEEPEEIKISEELQKFAETVSGNSEAAKELALKLVNKEITAVEAANQFFSGKNYSDNDTGRAAVINDLCLVYLFGDELPEEEFSTYAGYLSNGMSLKYVTYKFVYSEKFTAFCEANEINRGEIQITENRDRKPEVTAFVQRIYNVLLGRRADSSGLNTWTGNILSDSMTAADTIRNIMSSVEYRGKNISDDEYASMLFRLLLDREADEEELRTFVDSTLAVGHTRDAVLKKFVNSDEFTEFCDKSGIKRGEVYVGGWSLNSFGEKCYLDPDTGMMVTGYYTVNGINCYFDNDGMLRTDWSDLGTVVDASDSLYSFMDLERDIAELQNQYSSLVHVDTCGITADGRQIYDIAIGDLNAPCQTELIAALGGGESQQSRDVMADAERFLRNYYAGTYADTSYENLLDGCCIHIFPMVNPDGVSIAQYGLNGVRNESLKARIRSMYMMDFRDGVTDVSFDEYLVSWEANARGMDISKFISTSGNSEPRRTRPSAYGYSGDGSEAETLALLKSASKTSLSDSYLFSDYSGTVNNNSCALAEILSKIQGIEAPETKNTLSAYAEHLYRTVLGREPDSEGWNYWTQCLNDGRCSAVEIIRMFTESSEYEIKNASDADFVKMAYKAVCGREATDEEISRYQSLLGNGYSRSYVVFRLTETDDFAAMCENFGVTDAVYGGQGWSETSEGSVYYENGVKVCEDIRNIDGFTYYFDKKGRLGNGPVNVGKSGYYAKDGYVLSANGTNWAAEIKKENIRSESGSAQKMNIPLDFQFLYTKVICTVNGEDKRVRESGCGAASASMVIRYLTDETQYDPEYLFEWAYNNGEYYGYGLAESTVSKFLNMAGIPNYWINPSAEKVSAALRNGKPVIALVREGYFTTSGHYIVLTGITRDGYVTVNDPNNSSKCRLEYRLSEVVNQAKCFMICNESEPAEADAPKG